MLTAQGRASAYANQLVAGWAKGGVGWGPVGAAIRTGQVCVNMDNRDDVQTDPWTSAADEYMLHSMCVIPLAIGDGKTGVLSLYAEHPDVFTEDELEFLKQLAGDLVFGISLLGQREVLPAHNERQTDLRADQASTAEILEAANVLLVGLDREGQVILLNQHAALLLGYDKQELHGQNWFETAIPVDQCQKLKALYQDIGTGNLELPQQCINHVKTKVGGSRIIEWRNSTLTRDGQFDGCLAIGIDVTERVAEEEKLRNSEVRYRRLFESAKDGILILDATTGMVVDANPYLIELLGLTYEQLIGYRVWELGFLNDIAASRDNFLELQQREYIRYEDLPLETATGQRIDVEFISNVYSVNGNLVIQCNIRNISARRQAENDLQELHANLEMRVQERTTELAQANEALQRETVERMRAEESQLTAVLDERTRIAREIHDTLAQGFAGIVIQLEAAEEVLDEDKQAALGHLARARKLARESLADARRSMWALRPQMLDKGDLVYALSMFVDDLVKDTPIQIEFTHTGKRVRLPKEAEDGLLRICQEALMNSGKHSHAQHIALDLQLQKDFVEMRIEDDGCGFDASSAPFLRGLGIRIMKERAANINGTCTIISQPGQGAQVIVRVPASANREQNEQH